MTGSEVLDLYREARLATVPPPVDLPPFKVSYSVAVDRPRPRMFFRVHPGSLGLKARFLKDPDGGLVGISKRAPVWLQRHAVFKTTALCCPSDGRLFLWPIPTSSDSAARSVVDAAVGSWVWTEWNPTSSDYETHLLLNTDLAPEPRWVGQVKDLVYRGWANGLVRDGDHPCARRILTEITGASDD